MSVSLIILNLLTDHRRNSVCGQRVLFKFYLLKRVRVPVVAVILVLLVTLTFTIQVTAVVNQEVETIYRLTSLNQCEQWYYLPREQCSATCRVLARVAYNYMISEQHITRTTSQQAVAPQLLSIGVNFIIEFIEIFKLPSKKVLHQQRIFLTVRTFNPVHHCWAVHITLIT